MPLIRYAAILFRIALCYAIDATPALRQALLLMRAMSAAADAPCRRCLMRVILCLLLLLPRRCC